MRTLRNILKITGIGLALFLAAEIFLRGAGLTRLPLYTSDDKYEYLYLGNQKTRIYYNINFATNELGLRSNPIDPNKPKILLCGDSVINGGNRISNNRLASTLIDYLFLEYQVLNISAGSWGVTNSAEFIKKHNITGEVIILVISSHDYDDNPTFKTPLGVHPNFPISNRSTGIGGLLYKLKPVPRIYGSPDTTLSAGYDYFRDLSYDTPVRIYLHATKAELERGEYNHRGRAIIRWARENGIPLTRELDLDPDPEYYTDNIHFNNAGQKFLADKIRYIIGEALRD